MRMGRQDGRQVSAILKLESKQRVAADLRELRKDTCQVTRVAAKPQGGLPHRTTKGLA